MKTGPLSLSIVERRPLPLGVVSAIITTDLNKPQLKCAGCSAELIDKGREATVSRSQHGPIKYGGDAI